MSAQETKSISNWSEVWSLIYCKYTFDPNLQDILDHFLPFSCCCLLSTYLTYITIDYTYTLRIWVWGSDARPQHYRYVLLLHTAPFEISICNVHSVVHNRRWASIRKWFQFRELLGFVSAGCVHDSHCQANVIYKPNHTSQKPTWRVGRLPHFHVRGNYFWWAKTERIVI